MCYVTAGGTDTVAALPSDTYIVSHSEPLCVWVSGSSHPSSHPALALKLTTVTDAIEIACVFKKNKKPKNPKKTTHALLHI